MTSIEWEEFRREAKVFNDYMNKKYPLIRTVYTKDDWKRMAHNFSRSLIGVYKDLREENYSNLNIQAIENMGFKVNEYKLQKAKDELIIQNGGTITNNNNESKDDDDDKENDWNYERSKENHTIKYDSINNDKNEFESNYKNPYKNYKKRMTESSFKYNNHKYTLVRSNDKSKVKIAKHVKIL